ncbi:hypothetical protein SDC9_125973 [bioreactor metagenome]|uniref:Uncharacterized protein n=1 Tax=bioreactor metagenome TaxID=1076179 RepID=A0A645CPY2_9ZZZZ
MQFLLVVSFIIAVSFKQLLDIGGNKERTSVRDMPFELAHINVDACQIKISKMKIGIGDRFKPTNNISVLVLRIATDKERFYIGEQIFLFFDITKTFRILNSDNGQLLVGNKALEVIYKVK